MNTKTTLERPDIDAFLHSLMTTSETRLPLSEVHPPVASYPRHAFRSWSILAGLLVGGSALSVKWWNTSATPNEINQSRPADPPDRAVYGWQGYHRVTPDNRTQ
jgi:hypothetical protein